tara:strand:- start:4625 stop:5113 length:489 start_codon:yes stop_codon:yes gene_type:complete
MTDVSDFIHDQNRYERELAESMGWDFVEDQSKGSAYDFITPDGTKIEVKFDWDSIKTGNHYLEFAQSSDGGKNWIPSGFTLSADDAELWVVINNDWMRVFTINSLKQLITKNRSRLKITTTRAGVNFNRPNQFSKAYLIPYKILDEYATEKKPSPIKRSFTQ